ncbi:MAG: tryptophan 2,3-dioxygenase [Myxococcaceae bacterium]|nr:tryptophan 2,3-dioxygenase [Myxococcaceae bacterium]
MNRRDLEPGIHMHVPPQETYAAYLKLDVLLSAQSPRTEEHDEVLFIIQHQTSELWLKLMIHELDFAAGLVKADQLEPSFKVLARVGHIQRMLFEQWSVLETLTPFEYLKFRDALGRSSGFQSWQYRAVEYLLGNKSAEGLQAFTPGTPEHKVLSARLAQPSLYDEFLRHLKRRGHAVPADRLERDFTQPYERHPGVLKVFQDIYSAPDKAWDAYEMCEKLVDIEQRFQLWRYRHMLTVQRIIGFAPGTGGSSGVAFLKRALDLSFFPELWDVRTALTPRR